MASLLMGLFASCASRYSIEGSSSLNSLDGRMMYLRVDGYEGMSQNVDSCKVVHGRFDFSGNFDSVVIAQLFMGSERVMPLVLENGDLSVRLDHGRQSVVGGDYNERLSRFLSKMRTLEQKRWELDREFMKRMKEGDSFEEIQSELGKKSKRLYREMEDLEIKFMLDNYDNPLGPGYFMVVFGRYPIPVMTEQLENLLQLAPERFLKHPFVSSYVKRAKFVN